MRQLVELQVAHPSPKFCSSLHFVQVFPWSLKVLSVQAEHSAPVYDAQLGTVTLQEAPTGVI